MHDYTVCSEVRRKVIEVIICFYLIVSLLSAGYAEKYFEAISFLENAFVKEYIKTVFSIVCSGVGVGAIYILYDKWLWKYFIFLHKIPNLNGKWRAVVESPMKGSYIPEIEMEIKQTWNKIQIRGCSKSGTETISDSALLTEIYGRVYLGYSYWIHRKQDQIYRGFNMLEYSEENETLCGEYFSGKDIREELYQNLSKIKSKDRKKIMQKAKGCGSKGYIILRKV